MILSQCWLFAITSFVAVSLAHAQTNPAKQRMPQPTPKRFIRGFETQDGRVLEASPQTLPERKSLNFTLQGYEPDKPSANPDELRAALLKRVQALDAVVQKAIGPADADPKPPTEEIIKALKAAAAAAPAEVQRDLRNLLIAGAVTKELELLDPVTNDVIEADVKTWTYRRLDDETALCGPTIVAHPNSTLLIPVLNLMNKRDLKAGACDVHDLVRLSGNDLVNTPHGFDVINLHTHGLNVSPSWPADDVFREIRPFQIKYFVYHLHADHPDGTFWYHPHKHGAVGPHVASGMAGALIVRGTENHPIGLDKLGLEKGWSKEEDPPLLIQHLTAFALKAAPADHPAFIARPDFYAMRNLWRQQNIGSVQDVQPILACMKEHLADKDAPISTLLSGTLNAKLKPRKTGETYRLRLIHASIEAEWYFNVRKIGADGNPVNTDDVYIQVIAYDGMTLEEPYPLTQDGLLALSPGNRADVLVCFKPGAQGAYAITDANSSGNGIVGRFDVFAGNADAPKFLTKEEVAKYKLFKAPPAMPAGAASKFEAKLVGKKVEADPSGGFQLNPGEFYINDAPFPGWPNYFRVGEPAPVSFRTNGGGMHPIHIHVNPVLRPAAAPEEGEQRFGFPPGRYWTDTMLVGESGFIGVMPLDHFSGKPVVHCHILDHEDNGMMNTFVIRPPKTPIAPLPGVFDLTSIPQEVRSLLTPAWPASAQVPPQAAGDVIVFAFLPRSVGTEKCMHCVESIQAVAKLRAAKDSPPFRIIAVTGPNTTSVASLVQALGLDETKGDMLCLDGDLRAFQAMALVDGVPLFDGAKKLYTVPGSFKADGTLRHSADLMHGLFIVSPTGFLVSSNRGFIAHDDTEQTLVELRFAQNPGQSITTLRDKLIREVPATPAEQQLIRRDLPNIDRMQDRLKSFQGTR